MQGQQARARRQAKLTAVLAVVAAVLALVLPAVTPSAPKAAAATPTNPPTVNNWATGGSEWQYGGCSFRRGTGEAQPYADELCWLDMSEATGLTGAGKQVTKDLGRYTLSYSLQILWDDNRQAGKWAVGSTASDALSPGVTTNFGYVDDASLFGHNINGVDYFVAESGDPNKPVVKTSHDATWGRGFKFVLDRITMIDKATGQRVPNPRFVVADAQQTAVGTGSEVLTVTDPSSAVTATAMARFTPNLSTYAPACTPQTHKDNIFGSIPEGLKYGYNVVGPSDFGCYEYNGGVLSKTSTKAGMYLVNVPSPQRLEVGTYSWSTQAFAIALDFGRMRGNVSAETAQEKLATGQETSLDFAMATRLGTTNTPVPWQGANLYTQVARSLSTGDVTAVKSSDSQVFSSTASGDQAGQVFDRYDPVWTCTTPTKVDTIRAGTIPTGYSLTNDPAKKVSELVANNSANEPISCVVKWVSKYDPANLDLSKIVQGTAANYSENVNRTFKFAYACIPKHDGSKTDQQAIDEFTRAYPTPKLSDTVTVTPGTPYSIKALPAGATCAIAEDKSALPAADSGVDLALTLKSGATEVKSSGDPLQPIKVELAPLDANGTSNPVAATNDYSAHLGSIVLKKTVTGDPVAATFGASKTYQFDLYCKDAGFRKTIDLVLNSTDAANTLSGQTTVTGVPAGRDCTLTPLTGLSAEQQKTVLFDGRTVAVDANQDVKADAFGAYPVKIPDYPSGGTPKVTDVSIDASYSWKTADVKVVKQLAGPAGDAAAQAGGTYPVQYECVVPGDAASRIAGSINITTDAMNPVTIPGVRVGAECKIWETAITPPANISVDKTTLVGSDANDESISLSNTDAQTKPILVVHDTTDAAQNRVLVTNHYVNKLGTVTLNKAVVANGINSGLPSNYELFFDCGLRSYETPTGIASAPLTGNVTISANGTATLVATNSDSAVAEKLNDGPDGAMNVPYGNECTFSEPRPEITGTGILWSTDASKQKVTVTAATNQATVTNTFTAAGDGLTITRNAGKNAELTASLSYTLTCTNNGSPLALPNGGQFNLNDGESITFPATAVPQGSNCNLEAAPVTDKDRSRTNNGVTFPVKWTTEATYPDVSGQLATATSDSDVSALKVTGIVVGANAVVNITNEYDYKYSTFRATKSVEFPDVANNYISAARQQAKKDRTFESRFVCTLPSGDTATMAGSIVDGSTTEKRVEFTSPSLPIGTKCKASEDISQTAVGITLTQTVSLGSGPAQDALATATEPFTFTVGADQANVVFHNSYKRRLADVKLNKIANTPVDLSKFYDQFYTHNFTMACVDPLVTERPVLGTFTGTIHGPGTYTFSGIPVGADCTITGDHFGRLDLKQTVDGRDLETHIRPTSVDWDLARNDATTVHDEMSAEKDTTTSMDFAVVDNPAAGDPGTVVNLTNNYDWVLAPLNFTKTVTAAPADMALLENSKPEFDFTYKCEGVGYTIATGNSTLGDKTIPTTLKLDDTWTKGTDSRIYDQLKDLKVPSGALCTVTEAGVRNTPTELKLTTSVNGAEGNSTTLRPTENDDPAKSFDFTNSYSRKMQPVRMVALKDGYFEGVSSEGFQFAIKCTAGGKEIGTYTASRSLDRAKTNAAVTDPTPPLGGEIVELPAGAECTVDLGGSPAVAPNPNLAVTQGARTPFMQAGKWLGNTADPDNPKVKGLDIPLDQVTAQMKEYTYSFTVPIDAEATANGEVMTIAADFMYPRDKVGVTFTKQYKGSLPQDPTFEFSSNCYKDGTFTLAPDGTMTLPDVPVNQQCLFDEIGDGVDNAQPTLSLVSSGELLADVQVTNTFDSPDGTPGTHKIDATVKPVSDATVVNPDASNWTLVALNEYPSMKVTKKIDGSPISSVTGAIADTALIPHKNTAMTFHYTVENTGALPVTGLQFSEPGLKGRTVRVGSQEFQIGQDGIIPSDLCSAAGMDLAFGATAECTFEVLITEPTDKNFTYSKTDGTVTVTAQSSAGTVTGIDSYGAFRPMDSIAWLLPETGQQTLVWILGLGLCVLAYGLWRRYRSEKSDEENQD